MRPDVEESVKRTLLKQLPTELQERWKGASTQQINEILEARKEKGYETVKGYHTSDIDMNVGDHIRPGGDGTVHYTTSPETLYGKKAKYLYIVEGSSNDIINDKNLGWRQSHAAMKILDKTDITRGIPDEMETSFANVEYSE